MEVIEKNNKLIAEFMGERSVYNIRTDVDPMGYYEENTMNFHTSWDWLMPVVEKILDISFQDEGDAEDFYSIRDCMPDINHTYRAVVEFIKWYKNK